MMQIWQIHSVKLLGQCSESSFQMVTGTEVFDLRSDTNYTLLITNAVTYILQKQDINDTLHIMHAAHLLLTSTTAFRALSSIFHNGSFSTP